MQKKRRKYALTWFPPTRVWSKFYKGKRYYCPVKCTGKTDKNGYVASLQWWAQKKLEIDQPTSNFDSPHFVQFSSNYKKFGIVKRAGSKTVLAEGTISALIDAYLAAKKHQADTEQISDKMYSEHRNCINDFRVFAAGENAITIEEADGPLLASYQNTQIDYTKRPKSDGRISPVTARKRLQITKRFFEWCEEMEVIDRLPKILNRKFTSVKLKPPEPKFFSVEEIHQLWTASPQRTRLYIALGLNCGYKQSCISSLADSMVDWEKGIINRKRHKTSAPQVHKLWPITLQLLRKERTVAKGANPLLLGKNGTPLLHSRIKSDGSVTGTDIITLALNRAKRKLDLPIAGKGFSTFRNTAANEIEKVDPVQTSLFLGHTETEMKRHYVTPHHDKLFKAIDQLDSIFKLGTL